MLTDSQLCVCVACAASGPPCGRASGEEERGRHAAAKPSELAGEISEWETQTVPNCSKYLNLDLAELTTSWIL